MCPTCNFNRISSSETSSLQGESSPVFEENAAAGALLSFTTPPSSQGSPSHDPLGTSLDSAPTTGGFFPAQSASWDGCAVRNGTTPEVQATVSFIVPLSASHYGMLAICLHFDTQTDVILDKAVMTRKLALVKASKASNESPEMKEAAGLLAVLQMTPAPWSMGFNERVAHHYNSGQETVKEIDPDATEEEELSEGEPQSEDEPQEQPVVSDQQKVESPTTSAPPISAKAAGKQRKKCDHPAFVNSSQSDTLPAAISGSPASKVPIMRRPDPRGSASTQTTAKTYEFVNHTTSDLAGHKRKRAPPTPGNSGGSGSVLRKVRYP